MSGLNWSPQLEALHEHATATHPLDVLTRSAVLGELLPRLTAGASLLDLGCSSGHMLAEAAKLRPDVALAGVDLLEEGIAWARARVPLAEVLMADATHLPFADGSFDAIASLNVLEHVRDDGAVLRELVRVLRPGGRAAIVVPAGPRLYDYYDALLGHERRYGRRELAEKSAAAGLVVESLSGLGGLALPAFAAVKTFHRWRRRSLTPVEMEARVRSDIDRSAGSRMLAAACALEGGLRARGLHLPTGIRYLIVLSQS